MKENLLLLLFEVAILLLSQCDSIASSDSGVIEVVAPELRVSPAQAEDLELCYSLKVPEGDPVYATSFVPTYGAITAHHIKLYSCRPGVPTEKVWACGPQPFNVTQYVDGQVCHGEESIMYVWAKNASRLDLPNDVGFELKGGSYLVLALHYKGVPDLPKSVTPGVNVITTKKKPSKLARVFMMHSSKNYIDPHTTEFWDMECRIGEGIHPFHPFAFRTHAHNLGKAMWGYKIDGKTQEWTKIGAQDPLLPQSFYPVQTNGYITVNPGDTLAARCVMVNDLDHTVYTGPRDADEMCVYYVMYYVENYGTELTSDQIMKKCKSMSKKGRWENWYKNIPKDANTFNGIVYRETDPNKYKEYKNSVDKSIIPIIAPELKIPSSEVEDLQLCYAVQVPSDGPSYVTAFEPTQEAMMVAHHMRLFSCAPGMKNEKVWVCGPEGNPFPNEYAWGPPCMTEEKTIYVWAKNASKLELPEDVSFHLAPSSHIILALHYKNPGNTPKEITPGINMVVTKQRTSKSAGVFQLINDYDEIGPNRTEFWDTSCQVKDGILPFHPFAFRVHAHHIGRAIMGYKIDGETGEWTRIGIMDPMLPHAFYPVQTDGYIEIGPGDKLAARCIMVNDQTRVITTGPKDSDEMCIFYVMYYIETDKEPELTQVMDECLSLGKRGRWADYFETTPPDANQYNGVIYQESKPDHNEMESDGPMTIPIIAPELKINSNEVEDLQLCYAIKVPEDKPYFVTSFEPTEGAMIVAHHMRLFSCAPGMKKEKVWVCGPEGNPFPKEYAWGPPCSTEEKTIYVWAKNASKLVLPDDVGFQLAPGSHIILALHYKNPGNTPKEITPGINMVVTKKRPSKLAGVFQLINDYDKIAPNRTEFWDTSCQVKDGILPFYPFAFRVHAHHIGRAIMGYKIDGTTGEWTRIGIMDPMLPHAFYPVQTNGYIEIGPGDKLAARCIMVNDQSRVITTGPKDSDEMCIFYVMYYVETDKEPLNSQVMDECLSIGKEGQWGHWFDKIPPDANQYKGITYNESPRAADDFGIGENEVEEPNVIPVIAPQLRVDPSRVEDLQLCYAVKVSDGAPSYATAFEPTQESMVVAHHMRLFSCAPGMRNEEVWACGPEGNPFPNDYAWGPPCTTEEKTIYVWAKNASKLELPKDVGFHLPAGSHIVFALHYKNLGNVPKEMTPGINVAVTKKRPSKTAGVFQILNDYDGIEPNRTEFWDMACQVKDGVLPFHPFAFRVHGHHLGKAIMGYKVDGETGEWTRIGIMDPLLPQAFYPVQTNGYIKISAGDKLAARCIMVNDQDHPISTGPKDSDEMCLFYIMYFIDTDREPHEEQVMRECLTIGKEGTWTNWFENIPPDANQYNGVVYHESKPETRTISVVAPELRLTPDKSADLQLCYSVQVPEGETVYAISFEPTPGAVVAHHMKMFSCAPGVRTDNIWACGEEPIPTGEYEYGPDCLTDEKMLYVWAKNASRLDLPEDVGFHLKGGSHIVLSLHYKGVSNLPKSVTPGVNVIVTSKKPAKKAGVFMMVNSFDSIKAHTTEFWDVTCKVPDSVVPFYPFAYRTHSHHLGRGILGYKIDGPSHKWTLIGKNDPMLPQAFYPSPMNGTVAVYPGDMLASRCFMVNDRDEEVYTGPTDMDEMCIFYIMYYIDNPMYETMDDHTMHDCASSGKLGRWNNWFKNIPFGTDEFKGVKYRESIPKKTATKSNDHQKLYMKK